MISNRPKFKNQQKLLDLIDKLFLKVTEKKILLIKESSTLHRDRIIGYDLKLSMYIKKRAKITEGGYNFILEEMWNWRPFFSMDRSLLPKITRNFSDKDDKN